nr:G5 and 3D domain-containing protein [Lederbergia lenta]
MSRKKIGIFVASFIVFIATLSILTYEGTKATVALTIDGDKVVVKTHAKTIGEILKDLDINIKEDDFLSHSQDTLVKNKLNVVWEPAKLIAFHDGEDEKYFWTTAKTVQEFLNDKNITMEKHDQMNFLPEDEISENMKLKIERSFPLVLKNGNKEEKVWSTSTTVADFLIQQDVTLGSLDRVEPSPDKKVKPNDVVNVIRVEKVTDVVEEPIDYAIVTKKDSTITQGAEKVVQEGEEGLLKKEFEITKENGKEVARKQIAENKVKDSKDKIVAVGTKVIVAQASRGESKTTQVASKPSSETTAASSNDGKEMYVSATAYTAQCNGCSGITATGINLNANPNLKVIAVDPNVIPLGSKVWVEGYGHAVAGDTGGAIKGNKIDLFVSSKEQAYRYGKKQVKIRVLN